MLLIQVLLLAGFLVLAVAAGTDLDPDAALPVVAAMLGVCAMGVQNALVQVSLKGAPTTAVVTTNLTRLTMDLGEIRSTASRRWRRPPASERRGRCRATPSGVTAIEIGASRGPMPRRPLIRAAT